MPVCTSCSAVSVTLKSIFNTAKAANDCRILPDHFDCLMFSAIYCSLRSINDNSTLNKKRTQTHFFNDNTSGCILCHDKEYIFPAGEKARGKNVYAEISFCRIKAFGISTFTLMYSSVHKNLLCQIHLQAFDSPICQCTRG